MEGTQLLLFGYVYVLRDRLLVRGGAARRGVAAMARTMAKFSLYRRHRRCRCRCRRQHERALIMVGNGPANDSWLDFNGLQLRLPHSSTASFDVMAVAQIHKILIQISWWPEQEWCVHGLCWTGDC